MTSSMSKRVLMQGRHTVEDDVHEMLMRHHSDLLQAPDAHTLLGILARMQGLPAVLLSTESMIQ